jgi:hypothetical protein
MGLNKLQISTKLWVFITAVIGLICGVALVGLLRSAAILAEGRAQQMVAVELVQIATEWTGLTQTNAARNQAILLSNGDNLEGIFKDAVLGTSNQITELQKKIETMPLQEDAKAQMKKIADLRQKVIDLRNKARETKKAGDAEQALKMLNAEYLPAMAQYIDAQKGLVELQKKTRRRRGGTDRTAAHDQHHRHPRRTRGGHVCGLYGHFVAGAFHTRAAGPGQRTGRAHRQWRPQRHHQQQPPRRIRALAGIAQAHEPVAGPHGQRGAWQYRQHRDGQRRNCPRQQRLGPAHRANVFQLAVHRVKHGRADQHSSAQCRQRPAGQPIGIGRV